MITPDLTAYAGDLRVTFKEPRTGEDIRKMMEAVISKVTVTCFEQGAKLIGHVKGIVQIEKGGFLTVSSTTEDGRVQSKGDLKGGTELDMVINVIIYGLDVPKVEHIVKDVATEVIGKGFDLVSEEHHHHDDDEHSDKVITIQ